MEWLALLSVAAFLGSISCVESYNNFRVKRQEGNFNSNPSFNSFSNYGSVQQPSGHWHYNGNGNNVQGNFDEDEPDYFEEDDPQYFEEDDDSEFDPQVDMDSSNFDNSDENEQPEPDQNFEVDQVRSDGDLGKNGLDLLTVLPSLKNQLKSLSNGLVSKQTQGERDWQVTDNSSIDTVHTSNDPTGENTSNSEVLEEGLGDDYPQTRGQAKLTGDISNLFEGLLGSGDPNAILSNSLNKGVLKNILGDDSSQTRGQTKLTGDISNLLGGLLGSQNPNAILSNSLNKGVLKKNLGDDSSQTSGQTKLTGDISSLFEGLLGSGDPNAILSNSLNKGVLKNILGDDSSQTSGQTKLTGDISSLFGGLLGSAVPKAILSNGLSKGISKIGNIRNSVLDFRDRALDQRVGTAQRNELNQFDPRFQASLSKNNRESSAVDNQITWNKLRSLVSKFETSPPPVQQNEERTQSAKSGLLGLLGNDKGAVTSSSNKGRGVVESMKSGFLGLLGNDKGAVTSSSNKGGGDSGKRGFLGLLGNDRGAVTSSSNNGRGDDGNVSNKGGRFKFLSSAKNFATNPVDFMERKIRNKIKQTIKNEIKQSIGDVANRVVQFKSNITGELKESSKSKKSGKTSRNCLNIVTGLHTNRLFFNGKPIPDARILYIDKSYPTDFHSCPVNHQAEVLKDCLLKGNILLLSQPDKVKVEEEHGRELELIIAKDVVKDRINGVVDAFFQNFGRQFLKGVHIFRGNKDNES